MNALLLTLIASPAVSPVGSAVTEAPSVTRLLLSLLVVLAVVFALAWFWRRGTGLIRQQKHLKIISVLSVGTRERVMLIQVGEQQVLIGVTPNTISALQTFSTPVVDDHAPDHAKGEFGDVLKQMLKGQKS